MTETQHATTITTHWHGDLARYTGKVEQIHGGVFFEIVMLEGHLKGEHKWTPRSWRLALQEQQAAGR